MQSEIYNTPKIMKTVRFFSLLFWTLLCSIVSGLAQVTVGIKASPFFTNGSRFLGDYGNRSDATDSGDYYGVISPLNLGLTADFALTESVSLLSELNFLLQGTGRHDGSGENMTFSYVEIPFLLRYRPTGRRMLFVNVGPSVKVNVDARYRYGDQGADISERGGMNIREVVQPVVITANIGGGLLLDFGRPFGLIAEFRIGYDLTQVFKKSDGVALAPLGQWYFNDTHIVQMALTVGVTYRFR